MSTYSAPNEVTNGLVFYYDMSNTHKSWKGPPGTNDITIGAGYAGHFGGNLYVVQVYNRALSAGEVSQNFSSLRGRFGK